MSARDQLAANLRALMDASARYRSTLSIERRTEELGLKVGKSTVDRILKSLTTVNLDYIEVLAAVFNVEPWRLIAPLSRSSHAEALADEFDRRVPEPLREATYAQVLGQIMFAEEAARGFAPAAPPSEQPPPGPRTRPGARR